MDSPIIDDFDDICNLYDAEELANWLEWPGIITYSRTSPSQSGTASYATDWQAVHLQNFATSKGLPIIAAYHDAGSDSRKIGPKSRPELFKAIEQARQTGCPILAFEYRRFTRQPHKLRQFPDVRFVTLTSLKVPAEDLDAHCQREADKFYRLENPEKIAGRPKDMEARQALPFILANLGRPWADIAKDLGEGWSDNKVKRVFEDAFSSDIHVSRRSRQNGLVWSPLYLGGSQAEEK